ncbi:MAG: hypothetical protein ACREGL_06025 [Alphaproteobacteria bacterium]
MTEAWPWVTLALLGAFHGVNPAMGWLFAVGLGMQERRRAAVLRSLVPIALGHAASITAVVAVVAAAWAVIDLDAVRLVAGGAIVAFGAYRLARGWRHRARVGMRAGFADLALWSFLMATAHGAGLMIVPAYLGLPMVSHHHGAGNPNLGLAVGVEASIGLALAAVALHTAAMLAVAAAVALVIYDRVGLAILRRAWINLDLLWAFALIGAGALVLIL